MAVTLLSQELWKTLESREQNVNMEGLEFISGSEENPNRIE
jgi:hypothetical protein